MILVTGASGLIGSFVCRRLVNEGYGVKVLMREHSDKQLISDILDRVEVVQGDVLDISSLEVAFNNVDTVIHSAAVISFHKKEYNKMLKVNVEGTANVVNACLKLQVKNLIHVSSVAALGRTRKANPVISEDQKWENSKLNTGYADTKYRAELEAWRGQEEGLNVAVINPSVVLGPGDWTKSSTRLFKYVWDEKTFVSKGALNYVDVRDIDETVVRILKNGLYGERFILNGGNITYQKIFAMIGKYLNKKPPSVVAKPWMIHLFVTWQNIIYLFTRKLPTVSREVAQQSKYSFVYDSTKVKNALGITFRNLDETLQWTCQEFLKKHQTG